MVFRRFAPIAFLLVSCASASAQVKIWQDTMTFPTYEEGPPAVEPPYPAFDAKQPLIYPYPRRLRFTPNRLNQPWRALHMENEYLMCTVLPDLNGRLYTCRDKLTGKDVFYANPSVKKTDYGVRGSWVAMGIENNFPVAHTWTATSPVDFATLQNADGSASIWVGNIDRAYGMQWRIEYRLRPGWALLEQRVHLYNRSPARHRYEFWSSAQVAEDNKSQFIYPTYVMETHGRAELDKWPVNSSGVDQSIVGNHKDGWAGFTYESHEPFMAAYQPSTRVALTHFTDSAKLIGKKGFLWGSVDSARKKEYSDSALEYLEIQAGLFENQETFGFLNPEEEVAFTEFWIPARDLGGVVRGDEHGTLNLARAGSSVAVDFSPTHTVEGAHIRVTQDGKSIFDETAPLDPAATFHKTFEAGPAKCSIEITDQKGALLLKHVEGEYDAASAASVKLGPQPALKPQPARTTAEFMKAGEEQERQGFPFAAAHEYSEGLKLQADNAELKKAFARLDVEDSRFVDALKLLQPADSPNADAETRYYLGLALAGTGDDAAALKHWATLVADPWLIPAGIASSAAKARMGDLQGALALINQSLQHQSTSMRAREMQVILMRQLGQKDNALQSLAQGHDLDPTDSLLRLEAVKLGKSDPELSSHLAGDPERVLNLATAYMQLGLWADAVDVLSRRWERPPNPNAIELGSVLPQDNPLVNYYLGYCRTRSGTSGLPDFARASKMPVDYIFPNRSLDVPVLRMALTENANDATAWYLLGANYLGRGELEDAARAWQPARKLKFQWPQFYRDYDRLLGLLHLDAQAALALPESPAHQTPKKALVASANGPKPAAPLINEPAQPATPQPTREASAARALGLALQDHLDSALKVFTAENFPADKQDAEVREAYLELRAQNVMALARTHHCTEFAAAADHLGDEDKTLPFTFYGFDRFIKGARVQSYLGEGAEMCGDSKEARKYFTRAAKSAHGEPSSDLAFAYLASLQLESGPEAKKRLQAALDQLAGGEGQAYAYTRGMLLRALGRSSDATSELVEAAKPGKSFVITYLARLALKDTH